MDKICRHCNLIWHNADDIHFCTTCGRPLETVSQGGGDGQNSQQGGQGNPYGGDPGNQYGGSQGNQYGGQGNPYGGGNYQYGGQYQGSPYGGQRREIPRSSIIESYKKFWTQYFDFNGRTRRSDYWQVVLVNVIIGVILAAFSNIPFIGLLFQVLSVIYSLAALIPGIAICVRRLHDIGRSGLYYLFHPDSFRGGDHPPCLVCDGYGAGEKAMGRIPNGSMIKIRKEGCGAHVRPRSLLVFQIAAGCMRKLPGDDQGIVACVVRDFLCSVINMLVRIPQFSTMTTMFAAGTQQLLGPGSSCCRISSGYSSRPGPGTGTAGGRQE